MRHGFRSAAIVLLAGWLAGTAEPARAAEICPAFRWTTLGTAGGPVPTADRAEPSNLLTLAGGNYLVDAGDGAVNQLARVGLDPGAIRAVFISHHHHDHTGGLSAVIGLRWMNQFPGVLTVYGPPGTRELVDGLVAALAPQARVGFGLGVADRPPADSVRVVELRGGETVSLDGMTVTAAANSHFDHDGPAGANPPQSLSLRFAFGARAVTYTGDTGPSAAVTALARDSDLLVSEVIDLDRIVAEIRQRRADMPPAALVQMQRHLSTHHLRPADLGVLAQSARVGHVVLTHFAIPGPLASSAPDLLSGIRQSYAGPVDLARDLASFDVGCDQMDRPAGAQARG